MEDVYARLSKAGAVLCGRPGIDGRFTCDQPVAEVVREERGGSQRRLVALEGWTQDRTGVWQRTTRVEDLRRRGIAPGRRSPEQRVRIEFPALVRCPKCRTVQWLDAERLRVAAGPDAGAVRFSRWVARR
jgi:hypothetical protein